MGEGVGGGVVIVHSVEHKRYKASLCIILISDCRPEMDSNVMLIGP